MSLGAIFAGAIGQTELIIIIAIILLLFGGKKIPELMRGLGKGVKSFKDGMAGKDNEEIPNPGSKEDKTEKS
jgi:sec-independent protein translocase protein TatA